MRIEILYVGGHTWTDDDDGTIETETDRSMSEREFYCDAQIIEHRELDADPDGCCNRCERAQIAIDEIRAERMRRDALCIEQIVDPNELTLEERWAPYGEEWQWEQRLRHEEGY